MKIDKLSAARATDLARKTFNDPTLYVVSARGRKSLRRRTSELSFQIVSEGKTWSEVFRAAGTALTEEQLDELTLTEEQLDELTIGSGSICGLPL